jgi:hypothetical protein
MSSQAFHCIRENIMKVQLELENLEFFDPAAQEWTGSNLQQPQQLRITQAAENT